VDAVLRPLFLYAFLLLAFSMAGKRSMAEMDTFDMVTLLIISEATQNALLGEDHSMTYSLLVVTTLVSCTVLMAWFKARHPRVEHVLQGGPVILVEDGRLIRERMKKAYVDEQDVLSSARRAQVERLDQIKFAILETDGQISIIPKSQPGG
jgi:uncharacterized membrane protein YcaP (DUF421 family)